MNEILYSIINKKMGFKFINKEEAEKEKMNEVAKFASIEKSFDRSNRKLRAEFTFDNYVVGESNRLAFMFLSNI